MNYKIPLRMKLPLELTLWHQEMYQNNGCSHMGGASWAGLLSTLHYRPGQGCPSIIWSKENKYLIIMRLGRIGVRLTHSATFQVMQAKLLQPEGALHRGITKPVILKQVQHIAIIYTLGSAPVELYTIKFQHLLFRFLLLNASKRHS